MSILQTLNALQENVEADNTIGKKNKNCILIFTNIYFSSRPDFMLHCHTFFVSASGKQLYMGLVCSVHLPYEYVYIYIIYIYNIYMPTSQKETMH